MKFTGERVIPGQQDQDLFNEHRARYLFAQRLCAGMRVLDAACGSGYGSALLAEQARMVVGVDIAAEAVQYSRAQYSSGRVYFAQADCVALPFSDGQFDVIAAFEIIEHLPDAAAFLAELGRVLAPEGLLLLSTPNRLYYTEDRGETNPFHQREFSFAEFDELLQKHFAHHAIVFQNHVAGLAVGEEPQAQTSPAERYAVLTDSASAAETPEQSERAAHFLIALCSAQRLPAIQPVLYLPSTGNVLREREKYIHLLRHQVEEAQAELQRRTQALQRVIADLEADCARRTQWAAELDRRLAEKDRYVLDLQADYDSKVRWAQDLDREVERARGALQKLQGEFEERTAWALQLDRELQAVLESRWYRLGQTLRVGPPPSSNPAAGERGKP